MTPREKIDAAVAFLKSRNINSATAVPPMWRLCWRFGLSVPPPHFMGFLPIAAMTGLPFGLGFAALLVVFMSIVGTEPVAEPALVGLGTGALFGTAMAAHYRWTAWRLGLPPWATFDPGFDTDDESW